MKRLVFIAVVTIVAAVLADDVVEVEQGRLRGHRLTSRKGREIYAFQGIPYAKPPTGELRFKAPQPPEPWSGVLEATKEGSICVQRDFMLLTTEIMGDEDCLFLNVYTPKLPDSDVDTKPLDVMFWIHGGGWFSGSGNTDMYGPQYLLDHDVILVTINYRLGALGFLSTGDSTCPGNNGLKDQVAALRWVRDNIAAFGGNPNSVTIFGESAGGGSVHYHLFSPASKGLFHRAISESGTILCAWASAPKDANKEINKKVAALFDCPAEPSSEFISCLKNQDAYEVYRSEYVAMEKNLIVFKPVVETEVEEEDEAFLSEEPMTVILNPDGGEFVPWMVGTVSSEAGLFPTVFNKEEIQLEDHPMLGELFDYKADESVVKEVGRKIQKFYFGDEPVSNKSLTALINMFTDWYFLFGTNVAVKLHSQTAAPVYYYYFDYRGGRSFSEKFGNKPNYDYGVCHLDELLYLFPQDHHFPNRKMTPQEEQMIDIMTTLWTNFAKTSDPTPNNPEAGKWKPVTSPDVLEYAHIGSDGLHMKQGLHKKRMEFWESLPLMRQHVTSNKDEL